MKKGTLTHWHASGNGLIAKELVDSIVFILVMVK